MEYQTLVGVDDEGLWVEVWEDGHARRMWLLGPHKAAPWEQLHIAIERAEEGLAQAHTNGRAVADRYRVQVAQRQ